MVSPNQQKSLLYIVRWDSRFGCGGGQLPPVSRETADYLIDLFSSHFEDYRYWCEPAAAEPSSRSARQAASI